MILYCIAVINKDMQEADKKYSLLSDKEKSEVDKWPIRTLHEKLQSKN